MKIPALAASLLLAPVLAGSPRSRARSTASGDARVTASPYVARIVLASEARTRVSPMQTRTPRRA